MNIQWQLLKDLPPASFWVIVFSLSTFLILAFYRAYQAYVKARTLEDIPTSKIRSAAQGRVELKGTQHYFNNQVVIAPLSKLPCTWYYYEIAYYQKKGLVKLESNVSHEKLVINDGTGECIVDPIGAKVKTTTVDMWRGFQRHPNGKPKTWLGKMWGSLGPYRYKEYRMIDGHTLYATGYFQTSLEGVNVLSKGTSTARQPFILSSYDELKTLSAIRIEGRIWTIAYLACFIILCVFFLARLS